MHDKLNLVEFLTFLYNRFLETERFHNTKFVTPFWNNQRVLPRCLGTTTIFKDARLLQNIIIKVT